MADDGDDDGNEDVDGPAASLTAVPGSSPYRSQRTDMWFFLGVIVFVLVLVAAIFLIKP